MAPVQQRSNDVFGTPDNNNDSAGDQTPTSFTLTTWMLVLIIAGVLIVVTVFVFVIVYFMRKRRYSQAAQREHANRQNSFFRKRNTSAADRAEAEELERSLMIRKSLASRTWSLSTRDSQNLESARSSRHLEDVQMAPVEENVGAEESRDENKEWEARALMPRANSDLKDPALEGRGHPAFSPELELVTVPQPSRTQSPTRNIKGMQMSNPLPPLPPPPPPYERDTL
jgi:Tfp pilus assembly protein PilE